LSRFYAEKLNLNKQKVTEGTLKEIIDQLRSVRCNVALRNKHSEGKSCPDIIGKALENELKVLKNKGELNPVTEIVVETQKDADCTGGCSSCDNHETCHNVKPSKFICPDCGAELHRAEGCMVCDCGYSKC